MAIPFNGVPSDIRVPLFYGEIDNSMANIFSQNHRTLLLGQKATGALAAVNTPLLVSSESQAISLFGLGSMLHRMYRAYRLNDPFGEVWCICRTENVAGTAASGTSTITGPATANGSLVLYIAGQKVVIPVVSGDTATVMAAALVAAVNADLNIPVTAVNAAGVITWTCAWKGTTGNDITVFENFLGQAAGQVLPTGVGISHVAMAGGATDPVISNMITAMGDEEYDYIVNPWPTTEAMDALGTELNDYVGRWAWSRQIFGHMYTALRGTLGGLVAAGGARNDQHNTIAGFGADVPNPNYEYAAAYAGRNAVFLNVDPARPTQTGPLIGIMASRPGKRFTLTERQSLLKKGIATSVVGPGSVVQIERAITTYQKNAFNQPDVSYLDSETLHTSMYVIRRLRSVITSKYSRHKLADNGTEFAPGSAIVTPNVIRGELIAEYRAMEYDGIVENSELFAKYLIVERNATDPNRIDVLYPPDYVNQLRIFAALVQFRLQYPMAA